MFKAVQRRYYRRPFKLRQSDRAEILVSDKAAQSVYSQQCLIASQKQFISVTICSYWMEARSLVWSLPSFSGISSIERIEPMKT
ncbi:MAG TPA: hypothetical protein VN647_06680 [Nitrospira sp.]|nr:hypothetical protein [Nitrospira sp.]